MRTDINAVGDPTVRQAGGSESEADDLALTAGERHTRVVRTHGGRVGGDPLHHRGSGHRGTATTGVAIDHGGLGDGVAVAATRSPKGRNGTRMEVFESGDGRAVSERLSRAVGAAVPLLGQIPLHPQATKANHGGLALGLPGLPTGPRVDPDDEAELLANVRRMQGAPRACAVSTQPGTGSTNDSPRRAGVPDRCAGHAIPFDTEISESTPAGRSRR